MSLAEGSEMALVTLSAVAEEKHDEKYQMQKIKSSLPAWSSHILTSASIFVIHSLMALSTASHLLMLAAYTLSACENKKFLSILDLFHLSVSCHLLSGGVAVVQDGLDCFRFCLPVFHLCEGFCMVVWIYGEL